MYKNGTVIYVGNFEMPDKNAAAHRVLNNAKIFKELEYRVCFCGIEKNDTEVPDQPINMGSFFTWPTKYPHNSLEWIKAMLEFKVLKKAIVFYPDVIFVIAYNMHTIPFFRLFKYCKKNGIKLIADVTEWYENKPSLQPIKMMKCIDTWCMMHILHKWVDGMIVISSFLAEYYRKSVKNLIVLPPLVDITESKWENDPSNQMGITEFVYSGLPGQNKDKLGLILSAFNEIRDNNFHFSIIGITKDEFYKLFSKESTFADLMQDKISFLGRVSNEKSIRLLKQSDYSIFFRETTRKNNAGFPTKFVEAITSGTAIITNEFSDLKNNFPEDGKSILLKNLKQENVVQALKIAIEQGSIIRENKGSDQFDFHHYIKEMRIFLDIVGGKNECFYKNA